MQQKFSYNFKSRKAFRSKYFWIYPYYTIFKYNNYFYYVCFHHYLHCAINVHLKLYLKTELKAQWAELFNRLATMCLETIAFSLCFILLFSNAHLFYYPFFWCFVELYSKHYAIIMIDVFGTSKNFLSLRLIGVSEIAKKLYTQCIFFCVSIEK